jgi:hypothetical protein
MYKVGRYPELSQAEIERRMAQRGLDKKFEEKLEAAKAEKADSEKGAVQKP